MIRQEDSEFGLSIADQIASDLEFFSGFHDSLFDVSGRYLKPLYRIETTESELRILFDIPFVSSKKDLSVSSTEQTVTIEAKMKKSVSLMVGGPYQRKVEFDRYCATIELPRKVAPARAQAKFENGILIVSFQLVSSRRRVKIH